MLGSLLPKIVTDVPGPASRAQVDVLARHECPAITARRARRAQALGKADDDPIVWAQAVGANVVDVDGNRFVDLTSGFGVAFVGHRHPEVVSAAQEQSATLIHAMGDAWPDASRIRLLKRLAELCPGELSVSILGLSGADAVDAAVKTAVLATGRTGVLAFEGGYHGLSLGTVGLQGYKRAFTEPFAGITHPDVTHLPWGASFDAIEAALDGGNIGLVLAEPIQGRGGVREAPNGWLAGLAQRARERGALFALDEIQTGLGRTGDWFACTAEGVIPDLLCVGKSLAGGFPLSACVGTPRVMAAWGASRGEAIHTQTFLGHPVGCRAAHAVLDLIERDDLCGRAAQVGATLRTALEGLGLVVQGRGLILGARVPHSLTVSRELMQRGWLALPAGMQAEVLCLTPTVCLTQPQIDAFIADLADILGALP